MLAIERHDLHIGEAAPIEMGAQQGDAEFGRQIGHQPAIDLGEGGVRQHGLQAFARVTRLNAADGYRRAVMQALQHVETMFVVDEALDARAFALGCQGMALIWRAGSLGART
jgi:hypothetical protein